MTKKSPNSRHVVPNPKGGWNIKKPDAGKASKHTRTQSEAVDRARQIGQEHRWRRVAHPWQGRKDPRLGHGRARPRSEPAEGQAMSEVWSVVVGEPNDRGRPDGGDTQEIVIYEGRRRRRAEYATAKAKATRMAYRSVLLRRKKQVIEQWP